MTTKPLALAKKRVEAYGVKGMKSLPWRKSFASVEALQAWADKHSAEVHGIRDAD